MCHIAYMIDMQRALEILETGKWCSIAYLKYDPVKGTTGEICRIKKCRFMGDAWAKNAPADPLRPRSQQPEIRRDANHKENGTRNVRLANGGIRKFHYRLLFAINNEKVI